MPRLWMQWMTETALIFRHWLFNCLTRVLLTSSELGNSRGLSPFLFDIPSCSLTAGTSVAETNIVCNVPSPFSPSWQNHMIPHRWCAMKWSNSATGLEIRWATLACFNKKARVTRSQLAILVYTLVTFFLLMFSSETLRMAMEKLHKWSLIDPCHLHVWHGSPWGLGCFKQLFVDRANLWFKTHVQQAIRFVQDQTFDVTNLKTKGSNFLAISLKA